MPITSGTQLDLDDGEREEIISDDTTENAFIVEVNGQNPIRVDHRKQYAADGTTLSAGQTHTVSNLRGQKLYAAAFDGATSIRVRDASADVKSQSPKAVSVEGGSVTLDGEADIQDRAGREIGKARIEGASGVLIDPLAERDVTPVTDSTTSNATNVTLSLGAYRKAVDWFVEVSGAATLTVEVKTDGGTWRQLDTVDYMGATSEIEQYETAYNDIRARVDSNLTTLEGSSKGL